jgi:hypothetical protein
MLQKIVTIVCSGDGGNVSDNNELIKRENDKLRQQ